MRLQNKITSGAIVKLLLIFFAAAVLIAIGLGAAGYFGGSREDELINDGNGQQNEEVVKTPNCATEYIYSGDALSLGIESNTYYQVIGKTSAIDAGNYSATIYLKDKAKYTWDNGSDEDITIEWTIEKATFDKSDITFEDKTVILDGTPHSIAIEGNLPNNVSVIYSGNEQREEGLHTITAIFIYDKNNYNIIDDEVAVLTIERGVFDMSSVRFNPVRGVYYLSTEGVEKGHNATIEGSLPEGVAVKYIGASHTQAGVYEARAVFSHSNPNYAKIPDMITTITIDKAVYKNEHIALYDSEIKYDSMNHSIFLAPVDLPDGFIVTYNGNEKSQVGVHTVTATVTNESNKNYYNFDETYTATMTIY